MKCSCKLIFNFEKVNANKKSPFPFHGTQLAIYFFDRGIFLKKGGRFFFNWAWPSYYVEIWCGLVNMSF